MAVRFGVLGAIEAWRDGVPVDVGHARQRRVLGALLADAEGAVPADVLVDRVWGADAPDRGRQALYGYVSRLRQVLSGVGADIVRDQGGYRLTTQAGSVDVHRFRDLVGQADAVPDEEQAASLWEEALGLWRGEAYAGVDTPWFNAQRDFLEQERLAAQLDLADIRLRLGQHDRMLAELFARAEAHPLDERVAGQLMLALYRGGRSADALTHYQAIRRRFAEELGTDPGLALQQLYQQVLTADLALDVALAKAVAPAVRVSRPVPRQLPALPAAFVGRSRELAGLDGLLKDPVGDEPVLVISAIGGAGGMGKTWLALAWAHRHLDRFPDGQLFVDLRGFSPDSQPIDPVGAVRGFLGALGVAADRVPHDLDAQAALYRSVMADKRMLVVLDNAATAEQVVPLLPGSASCTVLVTSRHRLHGLIARHGARPLPLGMFTDAEAHALLVATLGPDHVAAEGHAVAELMALCGGFPLALGLIAARIRHHLPTADAVAELREFGLDALDADAPTASLPTVLSWSLRRLTERQRTVFALLGIAPGPDIGLPAATSLTGLPVRETRVVLRALADVSLLDPHPGGRYAMHDLVRTYATTYAHHNLPEPVQRAALERVVDFYRHTAHTADLFLNPHPAPIRLQPPTPSTPPQPLPDHPAALAWMDTHHSHLLAAQHTAAGHHRYQAVWHLAWTLTAFHRRRGHRHDELAVWQAATDAADHLPTATRTLAHRRLGSAHAALGWHEQAIEHLNQAHALAEHHHDPTQQAHNHHAIARAWERRGDDRQSLKHSRHARDLFHALGQTVWEAVALNAVGWFAARLGDYDTARDHCRQALTLHRRHHDPNGEADTLDSLGYIDHHTGHYHQAINHYQQALALYRTLGNTSQSADTLDRLGHPHAALNQHTQAHAVWREALELYREQGCETDAERVQRQLETPPTTPPASTS
jgi:DNA-binding SARP family transcriptional activator